MTLEEARNRTYWSRVDPSIRSAIEIEVSRGNSSLTLTTPINDISRRSLQLLGYKVSAPGTLISWY